mmetsp:Transcript_2979/g.8042  ORF Transcript_2979/g.8042 Transcript_2979/m.8042 type:complete len:310 (-) Transcript_2979:117-1046(-)
MEAASCESFIRMMRSPGLISRISPGHWRFQASTAPPGLTAFTWRQLASDSPGCTSRPSSTWSARLNVMVKGRAWGAGRAASEEGLPASAPSSRGAAVAPAAAESPGGVSASMLAASPPSPPEVGGARCGDKSSPKLPVAAPSDSGAPPLTFMGSATEVGESASCAHADAGPDDVRRSVAPRAPFPGGDAAPHGDGGAGQKVDNCFTSASRPERSARFSCSSLRQDSAQEVSCPCNSSASAICCSLMHLISCCPRCHNASCAAAVLHSMCACTDAATSSTSDSLQSSVAGSSSAAPWSWQPLTFSRPGGA